MFEISGTVALVTGGASGIGLAVAKQLLLNDAKGVAIADVDQTNGKTVSEELKKEFGNERIIFVLTDVTDKQSFENAFKQTVAVFKNIDILVNNAGMTDELDYEKMISINLTGPIHGVLLALENYVLNHRTGSVGIIINTASLAAPFPHPFCPIYSATMSGIITLTAAFGHKVHYNKTKIKVVAICPASTELNLTAVNRDEFDKYLKFKTTLFKQPVEYLAKNVINIIKEKSSGSVWIVKNNEDIVEYICETQDT